MCQEAESNLLSIALAESKDVADRVALQATQLQSNTEVLQLLVDLGRQDCQVMQLLLESSELKVLQLALKVINTDSTRCSQGRNMHICEGIREKSSERDEKEQRE